MKNDKYYIIKNKYLANGLQWLTGQRFYIYDDFDNKNIKIYSFEKTEKLLQALEEMNKIKEKL